MKTEIIAILMVALVGFTGSVSALPADLVGWDTPLERSWIYGGHLNDLKEDMLRQGMTEYQVSQRMDVLYYRYQAKIEKYTRMYNYINVTELTTDGPATGSFEIPNVAFSVGNSSFSLGPGTFSYNGNDITVTTTYYTVTATATAFDESAQTATLTNVVINGYAVLGTFEVTW